MKILSSSFPFALCFSDLMQGQYTPYGHTNRSHQSYLMNPSKVLLSPEFWAATTNQLQLVCEVQPAYHLWFNA